MKKILCSVFFTLVLFGLFATSSFAQATPSTAPSQGIKTAYPERSERASSAYPIRTDPDVPQDFHTYSQNVFIEILTSISCMLTGYDPLNINGKCLGINPLTHKIGYVEGQGGAIGIVGNMISMTFDIPVSSSTYAKDLASNFGISKSSYAADKTSGNGFAEGYGFSGLSPILNVWKIFRNLVYLFLVLLFIIIGLGIMFRLNIDARSVMSIQNQLPKIIVGIILVTFSYAIAGFIVDMMYVFMYLIYYIFTQQALGIDVSGLNPSYLQGTSPLGAIGGIGGSSDIAFGVAKPLGHILSSLFDNNFGHLIASIVGTMIGAGAGAGIGGPVGAVVGGAIGLAVGTFAGSKLLGVVGGLIAYIVITITIIWAMLRLWFLLLRSYIFFLIDVILAPFWIGLGLIPKGGAGFNSWFRDIVANLAVFPATLFILLLGKILVTQFGESSSKTSFVPPLIGNPGDISSFGPIIGLGIILLLPSVVTMVRDTLKAPGFKYTQAIGASLGQGQKFASLLGSKAKDSVWKSNHRDGSPERLKAVFMERFKHKAEHSKTMHTLGHAKDKIARNLPLVGKGNRANQSRRAADAAIHQNSQGAGVRGNSPHRAETVGGHQTTVNDNGTVTIHTPLGDETYDENLVHWDRNPIGATTSTGTQPQTGGTPQAPQPAGTPDPVAADVASRIQQAIDDRLTREGTRTFQDLPLAEQQEYYNDARREVGES